MATQTKSKSTTAKKADYDTLHELLVLKLQVLHDVEGQLIKALPKMEKAATDAKLKQAFADHLKETEEQEARIDEALELLGDAAKGKVQSEAIRGLIADSEWVIKNIKDDAAKDAALLASAQYVEHFEIAGYGTALAWAELMGHSDVADLLQETLSEESKADDLLTTIAENTVNEKVESGMES